MESEDKDRCQQKCYPAVRDLLKLVWEKNLKYVLQQEETLLLTCRFTRLKGNYLNMRAATFNTFDSTFLICTFRPNSSSVNFV